LDLQLPVQSVPIATKVESLNPAHGGFVATLFSGFVYLLPFDSFSFMFNFKFECSFLQTGLNQETGKLSQIVLQHLSEDLCLSR
jgi:hypothetical protein